MKPILFNARVISSFVKYCYTVWKIKPDKRELFNECVQTCSDTVCVQVRNNVLNNELFLSYLTEKEKKGNFIAVSPVRVHKADSCWL